MTEVGIDYVHLKALGTSKRGRDAAECPSAFVCYERDPCDCHRTLLLPAVGACAEVIDLYA